MKKGLSFLSRLTQMSVDTVTAIGKDVMDSINEAGTKEEKWWCLLRVSVYWLWGVLSVEGVLSVMDNREGE